MSIYRKIWQNHHNQSIPKGWHIHHIDDNRENNHPDNLMCVSPHVHWCIHFLQGDVVALSGKFIQGASEAGRKGGSKNKGKKRTLKHREEIRKRMAKNNPFAGKTHTEETKKRISEKNKGKNYSFWITDGVKNKKLKNGDDIPDGWKKGRVCPWSKESPGKDTRNLISKSHNKIYTCPHCNKSGGRMILRWHFDYCRLREGGPLKHINTINMGKYERTQETRDKLSRAAKKQKSK